MPGPAPTPTSILELRGSRLTAARTGEVRFDGKRPTCPPWLKGEARACWRRLLPQLERAGVLQAVDRELLAAYCWTWGEVSRLAGQITSKPKAKEAWRWAVQMDRCQKRLLQLAGQFGLSPASRTRVRVQEQERQCGADYARKRGSSAS